MTKGRPSLLYAVNVRSLIRECFASFFASQREEEV